MDVTLTEFLDASDARMNRFIAFLEAREAMRLSKTLIGGPGPHSDDPILANHRFCNINREHDAVTVFIHLNFRVPFKDHDRNFMVRQMLFCRIFNQPDVLAQVCPYTKAKYAVPKLQAYRTAGHKLMRGAYMMPPHGKGAKGQDIAEHWCKVIETASHKVDYNSMTTLKEVADALMKVCGIGPFVANQVCTDLRYIPVWGHDWKDWQSFILCGPGTRRGINRFHGRPLVFSQSDEKFTTELLTIREVLRPKLRHVFRDYFIDPNNLSNSFCEFDKYERAADQMEAGQEVTLRHYP